MNLIGNTPMIQIRYRLDGKIDVIYAKIESFNPTGSVKDRIAYYITEEAKAMGKLQEGQAIVEVTSGNTGIAFSAVGAYMHHPIHIFMPEWASEERKKLMRMYGATLHEVSKEEGGYLGALEQSKAFAKEIGGYMPSQFDNADNTLAHYYGTGPEILAQLPDVGAFISGVGSGGTIMGVAHRLRVAKRFQDKDVKIIALQPDVAPLLTNGEVAGEHKIEGIGDDFVPRIYDPSMVDDVYDVESDDAVNMASKLAKNLGLGVGISSGANFLAAAMFNAQNQENRKVVILFPDDNKKYLTTSLSNPEPVPNDALSERIELLDYKLVM